MKNDQNISVYEQSVHVYGRIWTGMALILMILAPVAICCARRLALTRKKADCATTNTTMMAERR